MTGAMEETQARPTPYDLIFGEGAFESERFPVIRAEAEDRAVDASDPGRFVMLTTVGALLRELQPEDAGAAALHEIGRLLFHAYHFWLFGRRVYAVERELARRLLSAAPAVGEWEMAPPCPSGYLQLPRNLVWARTAETAPAEPADGLFWTMFGSADPAVPPYARLDALLALGLRSDRPGLSVVPVSAALPGEPGHWADVRAREGATGAGAGTADFANVLPGGELGGLYSLVNEAEVLRLISLLFWHVAAHPGAVVPGGQAARASGEPASAAATAPAAAGASPPPFQVIRDVARGG